MLELIQSPWPWWVAGPALGLTAPALLVIGNRMLGVSATLRATCAAVAPAKIDYFRFDWRRVGGWNLLFALGIGIGGWLAVTYLGAGEVTVSAATGADLAALGLGPVQGLVPAELFEWSALATLPGIVTLVIGGFLVGFGASWAGGCTSGHAILGLTDRQLPSLVAVVGFFVGGLIVTWWVLPLVFGAST